MTTQTLAIGKRRFVLVPERDFQRLQKQAAKQVVNQDFAKEAMKELRAYKKTRKAANWADVKREWGCDLDWEMVPLVVRIAHRREVYRRL